MCLLWSKTVAVLLHCILQIELFVRAARMVAKGHMRPASRMFYMPALGFLSLFTVKVKVLFQNLCFDKVGWDEELTGKNRKDYDSLLLDLTCIDDIQVERCLLEKDKAIAQVEIHAFSDASEQAFPTVVYLRVVYESGEVSVCFLASKAKDAPKKKHSIPRLELMGAHLMAKLVKSVRSTLKDEFKDKQIDTLY